MTTTGMICFKHSGTTWLFSFTCWNNFYASSSSLLGNLCTYSLYTVCSFFIQFELQIWLFTNKIEKRFIKVQTEDFSKSYIRFLVFFYDSLCLFSRKLNYIIDSYIITYKRRLAVCVYLPFIIAGVDSSILACHSPL